MQGRLIQRFVAEIARLDTKSIADAGDYDEVFREVISEDTNGDGLGESQRKEFSPIEIDCQVKSDAWEALRANRLGNNFDTSITLVFHARDLRNQSLVSADGQPLIHTGDRLISLKDIFGNIVHTVRTPPGLYVIDSTPRGHGISMFAPTWNLLYVTFEPRNIP